MPILQSPFQFITETLLGELLVVITGVLFAQSLQGWWERRKYGNWRVVILKKSQEVLNKAISAGKAKAILEIPEDMSIFLKGLISPFGWINCDLMDEGPELHLLQIDDEQRQILIDLDRNPPPDPQKTQSVS